ncbi:hypothetical protein MAR_033714, partial [Mya arenaria]
RCRTPIDKVDDVFYQNGATFTVTRESCSAGNIPSFMGQITCEIVTEANYRITVKTADVSWWKFAGTDGGLKLYMYGSNGNIGKIILHGGFEPGDEDLTKGQFVDVGEIFKIRLGVKALSLTYDKWKPESVQIEDDARGVYYTFKHDWNEIDDTSIILYPVDEALCLTCYPILTLF